MQIVILAAGRGTRMGHLTDSIPKPMLEIKNKPILAYKIEMLPEEIDEVIFVIGYLGDKIKNFFGDFYAGRKISYVVQEDLNGSGAALHLAKDLLHDNFLVMMGDDLYAREDVKDIMKYEFAVLGFEVQNPKNFGVIYFNEKGALEEIVEKPNIKGAALANTALYKLKKSFFNYELVSSGEGKCEYGLPQTLAMIGKDLPIYVSRATNWFPIGNPEDLKRAEFEIEKFF